MLSCLILMQIDHSFVRASAVESQAHDHKRLLALPSTHQAFEERTADLSPSVPKIFKGFVKWFASTWLGQKFVPKLHLQLATDKSIVVKRFFKRYGVDMVTSNLFESNAFKKWSAIIETGYETRAEAEKEMVSSLVAYFGSAKVLRLLIEGMQNSKTENIAKRYEVRLIDHWMNDPEQTPLKLYSELNLKVDDGNFLKNANLPTWIVYAGDKDEDVNKPFRYLLTEVAKHQIDLDAVIAAGMAEGGTAGEIAMSMQLIHWRDHEMSTDDVFKLLKLDALENDKTILKTTALKIWISYVAINFSVGTNMYMKLNEKLSIKELATVLISSLNDSIFGGYFRNVRESMLIYWHSEAFTETKVFELLISNENAGNFFENPLMSLWLSYVKFIHEGNPDPTILDVLQQFSKDAKQLQQMISSAKNSDKKTIRDLATRLDKLL